MKTIFCILTAMMLLSSPNTYALFGHVAEEHQHRIQAEQKLEEQQHVAIKERQLSNRWQTTAFVLGIGSVVMLIVGTAIGSKGRHDANQS